MTKLTRKQSKERTRDRLIAGVIDIVRRDGLAGLTTSRVAEAAGVSQSNFYVHFKDMDDALTRAAAVISGQVRQAAHREREHLDLSNPRPAIRLAYRAVVDALLDEPKFTELFFALRRDASSPMGISFRLLLDDARAELMADLEKIGLTRERIPSLDCYGELVIGQTLTVTEALLDGRLTSRDEAVETLTEVTVAVTRSVVESMSRGVAAHG